MASVADGGSDEPKGAMVTGSEGAQAASDFLGPFSSFYSSMLSDVLDELGARPGVLAPGLVPYHGDGITPIVGLAYPVAMAPTREWVEIDRLLDMIQATPAGSVAVVASDGEIDAALWGGLVSSGVQAKGGLGAVIDGAVRDIHQIRELNFPVFGTHTCPRDIRGRGLVSSIDEPVNCRGALVNPRDLVFADTNGVVIVPADLIVDVRDRCTDRLAREEETQRLLTAGHSVHDVYARLKAI